MTRTRIKFCGVTRTCDAALCAELGVDAVGLNFYPKSPRCVTATVAADLVHTLGALVTPVGVFVETSPFQMQSIAQFAGLQVLQTYSETPPDFDFSPLGWFPAFRVKDEAGIEAVRTFLKGVKKTPPAAVVIDSYVAGEMGGTGHVAPWHLLAGLQLEVPLILAGGLTPDNVSEAISAVQPWGVDLASGIESAPGVKDAGKMRAFVQAVREADSRNILRADSRCSTAHRP